MTAIVGKKELALILTVDPEAFDPSRSYTIEQECDGVVIRWTGVRPQREEDGMTRIYLPIQRQ